MVRCIILRIATYEFHHIQVDNVAAVSRKSRMNAYAVAVFVAHKQRDW